MNQLIFRTSNTFKSSSDERGSLSAFNEIEEFLTKRVFYVTCKKDVWRGKHYHKNTTQIVMVLSGELDVKVTSLNGEISYGKMTPGTHYKHLPYTQFEFRAISEEAKILVLCNTLHDPDDYYDL